MTGTNIGNIYATVGADTKQFEAAMASVSSEALSTEKALYSATDAMSSGVAKAAKIAATAAAALGAAFVGLSIKATMLSAEFEQTKIAFTTMLGGAAQANSFLKQLQDFAAQTPFEFPQLLQSARMMKAFGFETKQVIPMLTAVGDAAAGLGLGGEAISRITLALGQMKAKGKVSGEEMRQLAEAGIPAWEYLARAAGKSVAEVQQLSERGALDADMAMKALIGGMSKDFGGMMENQSRTMLGIWSTFKDNLGFALRDMGDVIAGPVKAGLETVNSEFNKFISSGSMKRLMQDMGQAAVDFLIPVVQILGEMVVWLAKFRTAWIEATYIITWAQKRLAESYNDDEGVKKYTEEMEKIQSRWKESVSDASRLELAVLDIGGAMRKSSEEAKRFRDWQTKVGQGLSGKGMDFETASFLMGEGARFGPSEKTKEKEVSKTLSVADQKAKELRHKVELAQAAEIEAVDKAIWAAGMARRETQHQKDLRDAAEISAVDTALFQQKLAEETALSQKIQQMKVRTEQAQADEIYAVDLELHNKQLALKEAQRQKDLADAAEISAVDTAIWEQKQAQDEELAKQWGQHLKDVQLSAENLAKWTREGFISVSNRISDGIGNAFAQMIVYGQNLEKSLSALWKSIAASVIQALIQIAVQAAITAAALAFLGVPAGGGGFGGAIVKSLGFHGGTDFVPESGKAIAAHGGMSNVPLETTFMLQKGERVISPKQNEDLTRFLDSRGGGGGNQPIILQVDGATLAKIVTRNANLGGGRAGRYNLAVERS